MEKGKFLLIANYYFPELTGIGKYNGEMLDWLSKQGYECDAVVPYPYSPYWRVFSTDSCRSYWYKREAKLNKHNVAVTIFRCPHFVPAIPTGFKRVVSDLSFFTSALVRLLFLILYKKYDYVIVVSPSFILGFLGLFMKIRSSTKFIYHIQDLQVDAAYELGLVRWMPFIWLMYKLELIILKKADYVSSISEGMVKKIRRKYDRAIIMFPNWVNTNEIYPIQGKNNIKKNFDILQEQKVVLYSGAMGEKQGLMDLLETAKDLYYRSDIIFIVCSAGPYFDKLKRMASKMNLTNIKFFHLLPIDLYNELLNIADVHLVLQRNNANDLVMPSKLTSILSVGGLALVTAAPTTSLHELISINKIGHLIGQGSRDVLTLAILEVIKNEPISLKINARNYALTYLDIDTILSEFMHQIITL